MTIPGSPRVRRPTYALDRIDRRIKAREAAGGTALRAALLSPRSAATDKPNRACPSTVRARRVTLASRSVSRTPCSTVLVTEPSAVISLNTKSRKENRRQKRERVASLRGGYFADTGRLPSVISAGYVGQIRHSGKEREATRARGQRRDAISSVPSNEPGLRTGPESAYFVVGEDEPETGHTSPVPVRGNARVRLFRRPTCWCIFEPA